MGLEQAYDLDCETACSGGVRRLGITGKRLNERNNIWDCIMDGVR